MSDKPARLVHRPFGSTGLSVSQLGLAGSQGIDARAVERAFHELGVNYFFATPQMPGLCEGVRRLVRAGHRDAIVIASGAHLPWAVTLPREWAQSARALGVEHIDVFLLLRVQARFYVTGGTWPAMRRMREEGRVRALGVSCADVALARALVDELELDALMIRYGASERRAEEEVFATLGGKRPGIVTYTSTGWGARISPVGVSFALSHPVVDVALCGARTYEELRESIEAVGLP